MVRRDAQSQRLGSFKRPRLTQNLPCELRPCAGVINLAFQVFGVHPVFIFILVQRADGGFQISLKRLAVLSQVVQQAQQLAHLLQIQLA